MFILSPKYYNLFFLIAINQSTTIGLQAGSIFLPHSLVNSSIFLTPKAEWLLLAQNPHGICSTSLNTDTYQFSSVVFFFNGNQSIYQYRTPSKKYIPSSLIGSSSIFATPKAEWLLLAQNPHRICFTSFNTDTYQFSSVVFFFNDNQSIYQYRIPSRKYLPFSLIGDSSIFATPKAERLLLAQNPRGICSTSLNTNTYRFISVAFFFNNNQSIYLYRTPSRKYLPSSLIGNSPSIFATPKAEQLLLAQNPHGICSTSLNTDTYQFSSVVLFFNDNQSIYYYRTPNRKYLPSSLIFNSSIFAPPEAERLLLAQNPRGICSTSLNTDTYQFSSVGFFFNDNQSIYFYRLTSRKYLPSSLIGNSGIFHKKAEFIMFSHTNISIWQLGDFWVDNH